MKALPKKLRGTKRRGRHPEKALTDAFCRNVAEAGQYADGNGLYLHVDPTGARRWVQRLVIQGRSRSLGLGGCSLVSLAEARELALANRKLAREGGDPRSAGRHRTAGVPTFEEAARGVLAIYKGAWRAGGKTASQWEGSLRDHAFPQIGRRSVDQLTTADMMAVLLPLWTSKYVTARKLLHRISSVMKWAIAQGYRIDNPAGTSLIAALPRRPAPVQPPPRPVASRRRSGAHDRAGVPCLGGHEAGIRVPGADGDPLGRGPAGDLARGRPGRDGVDDSAHADEGEARAPSPAQPPRHRDPARGEAVAPRRRSLTS